MKKAISLILALSMSAIMLVGCGSSGGGRNDEKSSSSVEDKSATKVDASNIKVGVIYVGDENEGYTEAHMTGIKEMKKELGLKDSQIIEKTGIPEDDKC